MKEQMLDELTHQKESRTSLKVSNMTESELIMKYKFDNQILMKKLSEYKKAEKGAMQIVTDYDQMKQKYFNVLQETEK